MRGAQLTISGQLDQACFVPWICHRARLLDLKGWVSADAEGLQVVITGPAPLVDAMEVACSLGPAGGLVDDIVRREIVLGRSPHVFETLTGHPL